MDQHIEHSRQDLDELSEAVRGSFELLASNATARQLQLAEEQREATTKIRSKLEIFTSLFLVPTVVAGFFGANTYLPGGNGEHSMAGFEVMVTTMMLGSVLVYLVLRALRAQEERATAKKRAAA